MSTHIFRQVALERLSSPDQLDEALRVTSAHTWLALAGIFVLLGATSIWAWKGSIATTVNGQGIVIRRGGVYNVSSQGAGMVTEVNVQVGDIVGEHQVVARIAQPELLEQIRAAKQVADEANRDADRLLKMKAKSTGVALDALRHRREMYELQIRLLRQRMKAADRASDEDRLALEGQIASAEADLRQIEAQELSEKQQPAKTATEMRARVADAERRLAGLENELRVSGQIVSPYSGEVLELKADIGSVVAAGSPLLSVQPLMDTLELLLYVPATQAKQVKPAMNIEVSPTTVKREESGYMLGRVTHVSNYPATQAALMRNFQNEILVQSLIHEGPVTEVRARLEPDSTTPSGYAWSSGRGPAIRISSGTICAGRIVTRRQAPIELMVPYIKHNSGLD